MGCSKSYHFLFPSGALFSAELAFNNRRDPATCLQKKKKKTENVENKIR